ncbi:MAG: LysM domain-containing protein [Patescibacteria group bacterium]
MRRLILFFAALFLCATSHLALADEGKVQYELVTPEVRATAEHRVKYGESLWGIFKKYYGENPSVNKCRRLAELNAIKDPNRIRAGQVIKIYKPLIMLQTSVVSNRTTVSLPKAADNAVAALKKSLRQADIKMSIPDDLAQKVVIGLESSETIHQLNGEIVAATTYGKSAQGWTKIVAKGEVSGKSTITSINENYAALATLAKQCKNVIIQLVKKVLPPPPPPKVEIPPPPPKVEIPPPPPMPPILPPPELYSKPLERFLTVLYREAVCPNCEFDLAVGKVHQDYTDDAQDYSTWLYAAVRCQVWTDKDGNIHKAGVYINGSKWEGDWKKTFDFEGKIETFGVEHRIQTPDNQEYIFRIGYRTRQDLGASSDIYGRYQTETNYKALVFESEIDDNSRINELFFSRFKVGVALITELSSSRYSTWTNSLNGQVINLNEKPDITSGLEFKSEIRIFSDKRKLVTLSLESWVNFLFDGDSVYKLTPYFGILGDSLKIGYQATGRNTNGSHAFGSGFAWQLNLGQLYDYLKYKGWDSGIPQPEMNIFINPDAVLYGSTSVAGGGDVFTDPGALLEN